MQTVNKSVIEKIREIAAKEYPKEACGYVIAGKKRAEVVQCENISEEPTKFFRIARAETTRIADQGELLAVWHTHPEGNSEPSDADLASVEVMGIPWIIQGLRRAENESFDFAPYTVTNPSGFQMPYTQRPYVPGIFDCWSLAVDYYERDMGIRLNRYPYTQDSGEPGYFLFPTQYEHEGLVKLQHGTEPKKGDIFFMQILGERPNHCAIYLGDDRIIQHMHGRLSNLDVFGSRSKFVTHHLRHKSLCE